MRHCARIAKVEDVSTEYSAVAAREQTRAITRPLLETYALNTRHSLEQALWNDWKWLVIRFTVRIVGSKVVLQQGAEESSIPLRTGGAVSHFGPV